MNKIRNRLAEDFQDAEYAHAYLEENANMRIAAQVTALRLQNGWSQEQLASSSQMRQERVSKIESADFESLTLKTLRKLALAFDVHLSIRFESIYDAVNDFIELSNARLLCESRADSLAKLQSHQANDAFSSTYGGTISIPVGGTTANTAATRGIKIEA